MINVRPPAVAGQFYPADPEQLGHDLDRYLGSVKMEALSLKAVIAPHAGYPYSGPVAGTVYGRLCPRANPISRVVLMGPCHRVPFEGVAIPTATAFATPLGEVPVDQESLGRLRAHPGVAVLDEAHRLEHSLEVHLPFLQKMLGKFLLVPLVVGRAPPDLIADVLESVWGGPETLIVISSDLSHYHDYDTARALDARTSAAIESLDAEALTPGDACGCGPIQGLLRCARKHHLTARLMDLRNSGDTAGSRDQVVGYGAYAFA